MEFEKLERNVMTVTQTQLMDAINVEFRRDFLVMLQALFVLKFVGMA